MIVSGMNDLVSVIVPVYNVQKYLKDCIDSIVNQTYQNLDIILVDDGSTDDSGIICDEYAEADRRIHVIHKENGGNSDARNTGLLYAKGEWIIWVDNDDRIHNRQVEVLLKVAKWYHADIAIGGYFAVCDNNEMPIDEEIEEDFFKNAQVLTCKHLYDDTFIQKCSMILTVPWCKICRKELYSGLRYPLGRLGGHNPHDDTGTTWKLYENAHKVVTLLDKTLYYWRVYQNSTTGRKFDVSHFSGFDAYKEQLEYFIGTKKQRYIEIVFAEYLEFFFWCYNRMQEVNIDVSLLLPYFEYIKSHMKHIKLTKSVGWKNWMRYQYLRYYKIPKLILSRENFVNELFWK